MIRGKSAILNINCQVIFGDWYYSVTDASVHDSQEMDIVLQNSIDKNVLAYSAYRSEAQEIRLFEAGFASNVHERAYRGKPLNDAQKATNTEKSRMQAHVENVFGHITNSMRLFRQNHWFCSR